MGIRNGFPASVLTPNDDLELFPAREMMLRRGAVAHSAFTGFCITV
jgi:hypothetical protein